MVVNDQQSNAQAVTKRRGTGKAAFQVNYETLLLSNLRHVHDIEVGWKHAVTGPVQAKREFYLRLRADAIDLLNEGLRSMYRDVNMLANIMLDYLLEQEKQHAQSILHRAHEATD